MAGVAGTYWRWPTMMVFRLAFGLTPIQLLAILDILVVTVFVIRGVDVRMLLFLGAVPLFLAAGRPAAFISKLASEMANPATIVPFARRWVLLTCFG